jgi:hypothetical protein
MLRHLPFCWAVVGRLWGSCWRAFSAVKTKLDATHPVFTMQLFLTEAKGFAYYRPTTVPQLPHIKKSLSSFFYNFEFGMAFLLL